MKTPLLLTLLFACSSAEKGVRCHQDPNVPSCYCFNNDTDTNAEKCEPTQFKNGHCCATRGWPDDIGSGSCRCDQAICYQYQTGTKNCECRLDDAPPTGTLEVASCTPTSAQKCCVTKYGNCECNDFTSCTDGTLVQSCSPEVIASHCPIDRPLRVDTCRTEEDDPF